MGAKIDLTDADSRDEMTIDVDDIHSITPQDKGAYIVLKTGKSFLAMESQSRVLKMIETAKYGGFLLGEKNEKRKQRNYCIQRV